MTARRVFAILCLLLPLPALHAPPRKIMAFLPDLTLRAAPRRTLPQVLAIIEGWRNPESLVRRLHNPGALVFTGQLGAQRGPGGYAQFQGDEDGWRALRADLAHKRASGLALSGIVAARMPDPGVRRRALAILAGWGWLPGD